MLHWDFLRCEVCFLFPHCPLLSTESFNSLGFEKIISHSHDLKDPEFNAKGEWERMTLSQTTVKHAFKIQCWEYHWHNLICDYMFLLSSSILTLRLHLEWSGFLFSLFGVTPNILYSFLEEFKRITFSDLIPSWF